MRSKKLKRSRVKRTKAKKKLPKNINSKRINKKFTQNRKKNRKMKGGADEGGERAARTPIMRINACFGPNLDLDTAGKVTSAKNRPEAIRAFKELSEAGEINCTELENIFDEHPMKDAGNCWAGKRERLEDKKKQFLGGISGGICRPK